MRIIKHKLDDIPDGFNSVNVATAIHRLAKKRANEPGVLTTLCSLAVRVAAEFKARAIANIFWALAKLHFQHPVIVAALSEQVKVQARTFNAQDVANSL